MDRLTKQLAFSLEVDKEKRIERQTYVSDASRMENDAEHAWHAALMAILLEEYASESVDLLKTVSMLLLHDIVEIDAGDTYAYDADGIATQEAREQAAADRIFGLLPDDQREKFRALWDEFEAGSSPEARYAKVLDRIQPIMLNAATDGRAWKEHGVHLSKILKRNESTAQNAPALWQYAHDNWIQPHVEKGCIVEDE